MSSQSVIWGQEAAGPWDRPAVPQQCVSSVLFLPISHPKVKTLPIRESGEPLVDLVQINHPLIRRMVTFDPRYANTYEGYGQVRQGVFERLVAMLDALPHGVGIAYFEGIRPLAKQKAYFDKKFREILAEMPDPEHAYQETCKHVSPLIDNIPPHATGAALDLTLFDTRKGSEHLMDMGHFDTIFGPNDQQETFSPNTTSTMRENRLLLLEAAAQAGLVNYGFEWWHYSYGDRAWAYVTGHLEAHYGLAIDQESPLLSLQKQAYLQDIS